ncbi:MAG: lauroyl-Kdo(2)-lipid IV(A) myristoyltransferase [Arsenophonus sp.]|nr:MAG: lauroyl-Kdo(2)-lipid IV(A) myristoyltransferase [Arsenophonus sp.]
MKKKQEKNNKLGYIPTFHFMYLHPKYWVMWIGILLLVSIVYLPIEVRDLCLAKIGKLIGKLAKNTRRRAKINLLYCFPEFTEEEREKYIDKMFSVAPQSFAILTELVLKGAEKILVRTKWYNFEIIEALKKQGRNIIFMVPHCWAVDIPGMLLAERGEKMAAMFHHQKNALADYLWNKARCSFGGRLHSRKAGIRPFIASVKEGFWGFYLPDQDHGKKNSEFVDFFGTYKATLPAIGKLMKACNAEIVPLFPVYNYKTHQLHIYIRKPMRDIIGKNNQYIARRINEEVECLVKPYLEQYTWILKLLKTRKLGEIEPYLRDDLYQ